MPRPATIADHFYRQKSSYNAHNDSAFRRARDGVTSVGHGANWHYKSEPDWLKGIELARDIVRNDMLVGQGIRRLVNNVMQDGFDPDPDTGSEELNSRLKERWYEWAMNRNKCDLAREHEFNQQAKLALHQQLVDGDHLMLPNMSGRLEGVEAHRLRKPKGTTQNVFHGVKIDPETRERLEYWVTKENVNPWREVTHVRDVVKYKARDAEGNPLAFHIYDPRRTSQTRGITCLAPIVDPVGMHDDIQFAKLVQQQVTSCITFIRNRGKDWDPGGEDGQHGDSTDETWSNGNSYSRQSWVPGTEILSDRDETIMGFSPNIPGDGWIDQSMQIMAIISVNLELPLIVMLLDATATNFSGWRGALDQAKVGWRNIQHYMRDRMHRPVYEWQVRRWLEESRVQKGPGGKLWQEAARLGSREAAFRCSWRLPGWSYVEPLKDASAEILQRRNLLNSPRNLAALRGYDWDEIVSATVEDHGNAIIAALQRAEEINGKFKDAGITWRDILNGGTPDRISVSLSDQSGDTHDQPADKPIAKPKSVEQ